MKRSRWQCFCVYWRQSWEWPNFWLRTPLFAIGRYKRSRIFVRDGLWSGWMIDWIPASWNFTPEAGKLMYRYHWERMQRVDLE